MTWADFAAADMTRAVAVLPIAAIEQHGPHLPVGVDTHIMEGYLREAIARLPNDLNALFLPVQSIGKSNEHIAYPGTLTLSAETVIRAWTEIGESVARTGCRKLVIVNSHGGNIAAMDIAELNPLYDTPARATALLAARLLLNAITVRVGGGNA